MTNESDVLIVGGGIVGLATALALTEARPGLGVTLVDKESAVACHQTGRNSGVIHSGIYYAPGSMKAAMCRQGNASMVEFCRDHAIPHEICGKVIVATDPSELPRLESLAERASAHGLDFERLGPAGIRDHEPHAAGIAGLYVEGTGITDYRRVAETYASLIAARGATVMLGTKVTSARRDLGSGWVVETTSGEQRARTLVNCAGLHSDRMAAMAGTVPEAQIVPFRGEYFELGQSAHHLVTGLIYPVPDPSFPFLGVHLTKMVGGGVHAGPNAVLALAREGYRRRDVETRDLWETLRYSGFRRLARKHVRTGMAEMARSASRRLFLRSLRRLVPELTLDDLVPTHSGVRAQALSPDGKLVDDFLIIESDDAVHVCNAPSPAATSSLEIGKFIAGYVVG